MPTCKEFDFSGTILPKTWMLSPKTTFLECKSVLAPISARRTAPSRAGRLPSKAFPRQDELGHGVGDWTCHRKADSRRTDLQASGLSQSVRDSEKVSHQETTGNQRYTDTHYSVWRFVVLHCFIMTSFHVLLHVSSLS